MTAYVAGVYAPDAFRRPLRRGPTAQIDLVQSALDE